MRHPRPAPLFGLLLYTSRRGRLVLDRGERLAAALQGAILLLALGSLPLIRGAELDGWIPTFAILAVSIPTAAAFAAPQGWPRWLLAGVAALLGGLSIVGLSIGFLADPADAQRLHTGAFGLVLAGCVLSTWLASALASVKVRR